MRLHWIPGNSSEIWNLIMNMRSHVKCSAYSEASYLESGFPSEIGDAHWIFGFISKSLDTLLESGSHMEHGNLICNQESHLESEI